MNQYREFMSVDQLPKKPEDIKPLRQINGELQMVDAVVIAGLNVIGEEGHMCPTVTLLYVDGESGDMHGWSLCIGCPEQDEEIPYYFEIFNEEDSKTTARGTEIPNAMIYFQAEIDSELASEKTPIEKLDEIIAYVLPYISDGEPPPPDSSDETFVQVVSEETDEWVVIQIKDLFAKAELLLNKLAEDFADKKYNYWTLFDELNRRLNDSDFAHTWKKDSNNPDYNPNLGILEKEIGCKTVRVCIGLPSDGFNDVYVVIQLTPYDDD